MPQIAGFRGVLPDPTKLADMGKIDFKERLPSRDPGRALYRYHQLFQHGGRAVVRKAVIAAVRLAPWSEGTIRRHEAVTDTARGLELARIQTARAHLEPVLAGFRDAAGEIERHFRRVDGERPTIELATPDRTTHRLFRVPSAEILGQVRHTLAPKKLHILDGTDRYEAMLAYQAALAADKSIAMYSSVNYGLMCLVNLDDPALVVAPRHRVVTATGQKPEAILAAAKAWFIVEKLAGAARELAKQQAALADTLAHQPAFVMVFAGEVDAWKLTLSPDVSPNAEGVVAHRATQKLDPIVVDQLFVAKVLPAATVAVEGDAQAALAAVAKGAEAALIFRALTIDQLAHVAELGQTLPPGSTGFAPPLPRGLIASALDPDEDLQ
jgi:uncharacterized protein (DUF1015 family)